MALSSKDFTNASSSKRVTYMSGVLQISRTSLGFMENQSWPDIISTFFPSTLKHLCLQISLSLKSNFPQFNPEKVKQTLSSWCISFLLCPTPLATLSFLQLPPKANCFAPSVEHHRDSHRWGCIVALQCEQLFTQHLLNLWMPCTCQNLSVIQCSGKSALLADLLPSKSILKCAWNSDVQCHLFSSSFLFVWGS